MFGVTFGQTPGSSGGKAPEIGKLVGHWSGSGHVVVNWTKQRELPVNITILPTVWFAEQSATPRSLPHV